MLTIIILTAAAFIALLVFRPSLTVTTGGKVFAFLTLFVIPIGVGFLGLNQHMEHSKSTQFCLSCHTMEDYGKSLLIDDPRHVAAAHFQNSRVPREFACFTCHTSYTMFGDYKAKLHGLEHVYVYYLGKIPNPVRLYEPYNNRECLHCHNGTRTFEDASAHKRDEVSLAALKGNQISCMKSGCHDQIHDIKGLKTAKLWTEGAALLGKEP